MGKPADSNTIINSHAGGQTVHSIVEYHEKFEHVQSEW